MILKCFLDESGTHQGSPVTIMSGSLATLQQWNRFEHGVERLKKVYGFTIFHAKDFRQKTGEFSGWTNEKCGRLQLDLAKGVDRLMETVTCVLPERLYGEFYKSQQMPRRARPDTRYALCFRLVLTLMIFHAVGRLGHHKKFGETRLHVVLESGHKNAGDAARVYKELSHEMGELNSSLLASFSFVTKNEANALLVPDFIAYQTFRDEVADKSFDTTPPHGMTKRGPGLTYIKLTPSILAQASDEVAAKISELHRRILVGPASSLEEAASMALGKRYS